TYRASTPSPSPLNDTSPVATFGDRRPPSSARAVSIAARAPLASFARIGELARSRLTVPSGFANTESVAVRSETTSTRFLSLRALPLAAPISDAPPRPVFLFAFETGAFARSSSAAPAGTDTAVIAPAHSTPASTTNSGRDRNPDEPNETRARTIRRPLR